MEKFNNLDNSLQEVVAWMEKEMKQIRAGAANPNVLDSVYAESYGSRMQVVHLSTISLDGNSLKVVPFDKNQTKIIEQAIRDADLGLSLISESEGLRVVFPQLTTETREKFVKIAKEKFEDARIKIRQVRADVMEKIENEKKEGNISEDDYKKKKDLTQKSVDNTNAELQQMFGEKQDSILKI